VLAIFSGFSSDSLFGNIGSPAAGTIFFAVRTPPPHSGMIPGADRDTARRMDRASDRAFRIAKTIVVTWDLSLGVKVDWGQPGSVLMTFAFVRFTVSLQAISLQLVGGSEAWSWSHTFFQPW